MFSYSKTLDFIGVLEFRNRLILIIVGAMFFTAAGYFLYRRKTECVHVFTPLEEMISIDEQRFDAFREKALR